MNLCEKEPRTEKPKTKERKAKNTNEKRNHK